MGKENGKGWDRKGVDEYARSGAFRGARVSEVVLVRKWTDERTLPCN